MSIDRAALDALARGQVPPGVHLGQVATVPQIRLDDEVVAKLHERLVDEEVYKRRITEQQLKHADAGRALEVLNVIQGHNLGKAESFSTTEDLELARETRRAALHVLKSYLSSSR